MATSFRHVVGLQEPPRNTGSGERGGGMDGEVKERKINKHVSTVYIPK